MIKHFLGMVRFSHTLFAMPFAMASMLWAAKGFPSIRLFLLITLCMITCRNTAMAFNRWVDAKIDKENPRTAKRHIPAGILSKNQVLWFLIFNAILFIALTYFINLLAFSLAVPTLLIVYGYSLAKRFTSLSHFILGLAIGISPVGAWIAVRGGFSWEPILLSSVLILWIAGFDIIYATQDYDFDKKNGLHSMVVKLGIKSALNLSKGLHLLMWCLLVVLEWIGNLGISYSISLACVTCLLLYLHFFRRSAALDSLNQDFFIANIAISLIVFLGIGMAFI